MSFRLRRPELALFLILALVISGVGVLSLDVRAEEPANAEFEATWARTDRPVFDLMVSRTWIWGPEAITPAMTEPYAEAEGGEREVQYFDKSRMERSTDPNVDPSSPWVVTNGLLPVELITGLMQLGDDQFEQHPPAEINIAGDPDDPSAPTYADVAPLLDAPATAEGDVIVATLDGDGNTGMDEEFAEYGVTAGYYVSETGHTIASVFWNFMNSQGTVYQDGQFVESRLFEDPFFAFGFPVTEPYWVTMNLNGEPTDILVQVFERRVATYTPSNPEGWRVESGNAGQHYYQWRYEILPGIDDDPEETPPPPEPEPSPTPTPTPEPEPGEPDACLHSHCDLPFGLGEIGEPGDEPLGDAYSPLSEPYLVFPVVGEDEIGELVTSTGGDAQLGFPKTISVVAQVLPVEEPYDVYYVADFNDGSVFISDRMDSHLGLFISHTWLGRGTFDVKIWAVNPDENTRNEVVTVPIVVE